MSGGCAEFVSAVHVPLLSADADGCRTITNWVREFEKWVPHLRVVSIMLPFRPASELIGDLGSLLRRSGM